MTMILKPSNINNDKIPGHTTSGAVEIDGTPPPIMPSSGLQEAYGGIPSPTFMNTTQLNQTAIAVGDDSSRVELRGGPDILTPSIVEGSDFPRPAAMANQSQQHAIHQRIEA